MKNPVRIATLLGICSVLMCMNDSNTFDPVTVTIDPSEKYQTIHGWEALADAGQFEEKEAFEHGKATLFELAAGTGINRLRVEVRSGVENKTNYFQQWQIGQIPHQDFRNNRYVIQNDNSDPRSIDWSGFHFSELDGIIEQVVIPFKQALEARGKSLYINLNYVDFADTDWEHFNHPDEYAEFMEAVFLHMDQEYGFVPDAIEIILEPNNSNWNGESLGRAMVATAERLAERGYHPEFVAPSTSSLSGAITYFDAMIEIPGTADLVDELSYHRYGGVSQENLEIVAERGKAYGIRTSMLEWWTPDNTYETLHEDLKVGMNGVWQQGALAAPTVWDIPTAIVTIDPSAPSHLTRMTTFTSQYFRYINKGAQRIGAASGDEASFDPLAFVNTDGGHVVVVKAERGGDIRIEGLPPGRYGRSYTTSDAADVNGGEVELQEGEVLEASIPQRGVLTVFSGSSGSVSNESDGELPETVRFEENYPNPFSQSTTIRFQLSRSMHVVLQVFNLAGQEIATLLNATLPAGEHSAVWEASNLPSGVYLCRLTADGYSWTRELTLAK